MKVDFKQFLHPILNLINFPEDKEIPCDSYFNILIDALNNDKINCSFLIQEDFLSMFLFDQQSKEIASYYQQNKVALQLFLTIFGSDSCNSDTQFQIFHKFLQATQYLKTDKTFLKQYLCDKHQSFYYLS